MNWSYCEISLKDDNNKGNFMQVHAEHWFMRGMISTSISTQTWYVLCNTIVYILNNTNRPEKK